MTDKSSNYIKTICLIIATLALISCAIVFQKHSLALIAWINGLGWFAPILFLITYCMASMMFLPTMVLTLAGGAIFGPLTGTLLNLLGATMGAAFSFLISRHLIYDWFLKKRGARLDKLISGVEQKGWLFVAFLRLVPVIPFNLVNYGLGVTRIKFRLYLITTFVFLIPAEIIYTYCGYAGIDALARPDHFYRNTVMAFLGLILLFWLLIKLFKKRKTTLSKT